jgi:hypothetical protein
MSRSNVTPPPPNKLIAIIPKTGDVGWPGAAHVLEDSTPVGVVGLTILISSFSRMVTSIRAAGSTAAGSWQVVGTKGMGVLTHENAIVQVSLATMEHPYTPVYTSLV